MQFKILILLVDKTSQKRHMNTSRKQYKAIYSIWLHIYIQNTGTGMDVSLSLGCQFNELR